MTSWVATSCPLTQASAWPTTPLTISVACWPGPRLLLKSVRYHQGTLNGGVVTAPASVVKPKHLRRLSEKKTSGHAPFCTRASISVPGAPASSGFTCSHPDVEKPGAEMSVPLCGALVLSCTCHPPRPSVVVP